MAPLTQTTLKASASSSCCAGIGGNLYLDVDGVLADFATAAYFRMNKTPPPVGSKPEWDIPKVCGVSGDEFWRKIDIYTFWRYLKPYPGAAKFARSLKNVVLCTRSGPSPEFATARMEWIDEYIGEYPTIIIRGRKATKSWLANPDCILVDDKPEEVEGFMDAGGNSVLVRRPWNTTDKDVSYDKVNYDEVMADIATCIL
jgi:5'(3')-deoxyribonucleotidase